MRKCFLRERTPSSSPVWITGEIDIYVYAARTIRKDEGG